VIDWASPGLLALGKVQPPLYHDGTREAGGNTFIQKLELQRLYCEPYAESAAPNRVLAKLGFHLVKRYRTTPGIINFRAEGQSVCHRAPGSGLIRRVS